MKRTPLQVSLHAREPSVVELTVGDCVQLDRVIPSTHGNLAERHGRLLDPGTTAIALPPGDDYFKTLSDAHLRVVTGGVTGRRHHTVKCVPPPPGAPDIRGDGEDGEAPSFTTERLRHGPGEPA